MNITTTAKVSGSYVFFDTSDTDHAALQGELRGISDPKTGGSLERFCPDVYTPVKALRKALQDFKNTLQSKHAIDKVSVDKHADVDVNGFELFATQFGDLQNMRQHIVSAVVSASGAVSVTSVNGQTGMPWDDSLRSLSTVESDLTSEVAHYLSLVPSADISGMLVDLTKHFNATSVRAGGGLYYVPEDCVSGMAELSDMFQRLKSAGQSSAEIHQTRIVLDTDSVRTVQAAISKEIEQAVNEINKEVFSGGLKEKALETRIERCKALRERAKEYEQILSAPLADVLALVDLTERTANQALAISEQHDAFAGML